MHTAPFSVTDWNCVRQKPQQCTSSRWHTLQLSHFHRRLFMDLPDNLSDPLNIIVLFDARGTVSLVRGHSEMLKV